MRPIFKDGNVRKVGFYSVSVSWALLAMKLRTPCGNERCTIRSLVDFAFALFLGSVTKAQFDPQMVLIEL
jgi:hypothetical protein